MYDFAIHQPATLAEAKTLFEKCEDALYLSGGHTLLPSMKQRLIAPSDLIDISAIAEIQGIEATDDAVSVGAFTTHASIASSSEVRSRVPALADLAAGIGDMQVRNRGTIGGSIANSDPAADYPAAILALDATITTDSREIAADDYFKGMFETALHEGELITRVRFRVPHRAAYVKFPNPASRYAIVGVFVAEFDDAVRVAVTGATASVFRLKELEAALSENMDAAAVDQLELDPEEMNTDLHASGEYRVNLVKVMAKRAIAAL